MKKSLKIWVLLTYLLMVSVNGMANALPINGQNTGQVSDAYPNLFAPAGLTFSIWGVIYLLLALYTIYQLGWISPESSKARGPLLQKVGWLFSLTSIANGAWIFAWHYHVQWLSLLLIVTILVLLIQINWILQKESFTLRELWMIRIPFGVYFGWITVATIANVTTLLVSMGWNGFGFSEVAWTVIILIVGSVIGLLTLRRNRNVAYGIVLIWAYGGILLKHASSDGFGAAYPMVMVTVGLCIFAFIAGVLCHFYCRKSTVKPTP
jgi:hypothetical protein